MADMLYDNAGSAYYQNPDGTYMDPYGNKVDLIDGYITLSTSKIHVGVDPSKKGNLYLVLGIVAVAIAGGLFFYFLLPRRVE